MFGGVVHSVGGDDLMRKRTGGKSAVVPGGSPRRERCCNPINLILCLDMEMTP